MDRFVCPNCGASWYGTDDGYECEWCERKCLAIREGQRRALLFPDWLGWDDRYWRLSEIDKRVWENTRGIRGDFVAQWQTKLFRAIGDLVTETEASQALSRNAKWMTHMQRFAS